MSTRPAASHHPTTLNARAAAKINLALLVGPRGDDGYHEVVTVLQSVAVWDELEVELVPEGFGLEVRGNGLPADESNLVLLAARELARRARNLPGARFRLRKSIPVAAGLGGGSADGAAALLALDRLWGLGLPPANLAAIAREVGTDVAFCVAGGTQLGTGRGERLEKVRAAGETWWVLGVDERGLTTADVYRRYDEMGLARELRGREPSRVLEALAAGKPQQLAGALVNDLEAAATDLRPELGVARSRMLDAGALGAVLSGSGPTMLGLCADEEHAERVARAVEDGFDRVEVAHGPVPGVELT